jgi:two-component system, OmpR family, response regulator
VAKVLIVDDDEALRKLMRIELGSSHEIIDTSEPEHGLALALEHNPDVVLLDLRMPKYSGYELCQTLTSLSLTQRIPVVIVSGEAGAQTKEHCRQLGAVGYFEKPIDFDALRESLEQIATTQRHVPRGEVRVRLRVPLKLRGIDTDGNGFHELATTENVSLSGFLCDSTVKVRAGAMVEVFLAGAREELVGKAAIVHCDGKGAPVYRYGCRFVEKSGPWVLK